MREDPRRETFLLSLDAQDLHVLRYRPHLDAGTVVNPQAVCLTAAGTALPFLPGEAVEQVVDGMIDRPAGNHGVVPVVAMT